ncbi:hypothetical protein BJ138DRAFT_1117640 [Hygrophoropsis aurantiaca]|uniref:Uncharacterized protein n=1 Tax=Hygrophoropsis aurantiaca TaxID=72124 RepID=A0ACB8A006_9AGAM|nr:hypothetical protein BJ138DRAFT_1117640 [Hygrophoropsis aurantiaca]
MLAHRSEQQVSPQNELKIPQHASRVFVQPERRLWPQNKPGKRSAFPGASLSLHGPLSIDEQLTILVEGSLPAFMDSLCQDVISHKTDAIGNIQRALALAEDILEHATSSKNGILNSLGRFSKPDSNRFDDAPFSSLFISLFISLNHSLFPEVYASSTRFLRDFYATLHTMVGARWTTPEQLQWLEDYYDKHYAPLVQHKNYTTFWNPCYMAWFQKFSERALLFGDRSSTHDLDDVEKARLQVAITKRQGQLSTWFRNNAKGKRGTTARAATKNANISSNLFSMSTKGLRGPQEVEVYSKMIYEDQVKPIMLDKRSKGEVAGKMSVTERRAVTQSLLDNADEETKAQVHAKTMEMRKAIAVKKAALKSPGALTPEQTQAIINDLPSIVTNFAKTTFSKSGWSMTVLMGGMDPSRGKLRSGFVHIGPDGAPKFSEAYDGFPKTMEAFDMYVRQCNASSLSSKIDNYTPAPMEEMGGIAPENAITPTIYTLETSGESSTAASTFDTSLTTATNSTEPASATDVSMTIHLMYHTLIH